MRLLEASETMACGRVIRWHTRRTLAVQTVADHSFGVAQITRRLAAAAGLGAQHTLEAVGWALDHDAHEATCCDLPAPIKAMLRSAGLDLDLRAQRRFWGMGGSTFGLSHAARALVSAADVMEAALWARQYLPEIAERVAREAVDAIDAHLNDYPGAAVEAMGMLEVDHG